MRNDRKPGSPRRTLRVRAVMPSEDRRRPRRRRGRRRWGRPGRSPRRQATIAMRVPAGAAARVDADWPLSSMPATVPPATLPSGMISSKVSAPKLVSSGSLVRSSRPLSRCRCPRGRPGRRCRRGWSGPTGVDVVVLEDGDAALARAGRGAAEAVASPCWPSRCRRWRKRRCRRSSAARRCCRARRGSRPLPTARRASRRRTRPPSDRSARWCRRGRCPSSRRWRRACESSRLIADRVVAAVRLTSPRG